MPPKQGSSPHPIAPKLSAICRSDLPSVLVVENLAYEIGWSTRNFLDCLDAGYTCQKMTIGQEIMGYGILSLVLDEAHLLNLCIHPEQQGRGYGKFLLNHLISFARTNHAKMMFLEVRESNQKATRLYQALGFNEIGVRRHYYPSRSGREHAIVFGCALDQDMFVQARAPGLT